MRLVSFLFRFIHLNLQQRALLSSTILYPTGFNVPNKHKCPCSTSEQILAPLFWYLLSPSHTVKRKLGWEMTKILAVSQTTIRGTSEAVITVRREAHFPVNVDNRSGLCSTCPGLWRMYWLKLNQCFSSCFCDYLIIADDGVCVCMCVWRGRLCPHLPCLCGNLIAFIVLIWQNSLFCCGIIFIRGL